MSKVKVISTVDNISVNMNDMGIRFHRVWAKAGNFVAIEQDVLEELMMDQGFEYMVKTGILYIEDMETKIALGLEEEGTAEPTNIIYLTNDLKLQYWKILSLQAFKDKVNKLSLEQVRDLAQYAIDNTILEPDKAKFVKELSGIDVLKSAMRDQE